MHQTIFTHLVRSFTNAFTGLAYVWREERNFRIQAIVAVFVLFGLWWFGFSYIDLALSVFAIVLVLAAEVTNTAFEDTMNRIEPNADPLIGRIKDIAAGVVVLNVIGALVIAGIVILNRFW